MDERSSERLLLIVLLEGGARRKKSVEEVFQKSRCVYGYTLLIF